MNPIVITKDEWARIVKWTDENKEDPDARRRREYLKYLNDASANMTKTWPNSLENVNKRNEEIRRARIETAENANTEFYKHYVKRKKMERKCMLHSARDTIFKNKDAPKLMLGSVVESIVLHERNAQVEFNEKYIKSYKEEQKRLADEEIVRKAKEWHEMMEARKKKKWEVNKQHQKEILEQAHENSERKRKEYEEELRMQRQDIMNSNKEMEQIKEFEKNYAETEKARIWADNERSLKETAQRRKEQETRNHMDDQLIEVLTRSRDRVECTRKKTEKEIRAKKLRILEAISKRMATGDASRDAKEQAILEKAVKKKNAEIDARHKAQMEKDERIRRERQESHEQYLRDEAQRLHEEHTMYKWALINRFKNQEIYEDFKENLRKEKLRKTLEYRDDINRLRKERADRDARELAETRYFYGELAEKKFRHADNQLLTHATKLLEEAKANGRPTLPLQKTIDRYCKMYRLYPMPPLPSSLAEHFPRYSPADGSAADAAYTEPRPPTPPPKEDDGDLFATDQRDGLQELAEPGPSKETKKETKKPETKPEPKAAASDYKRQGPANGLQKKPSQSDVCLPPIDDSFCICHLKQQWDNKTIVYNPRHDDEDCKKFKLPKT